MGKALPPTLSKPPAPRFQQVIAADSGGVRSQELRAKSRKSVLKSPLLDLPTTPLTSLARCQPTTGCACSSISSCACLGQHMSLLENDVPSIAVHRAKGMLDQRLAKISWWHRGKMACSLRRSVAKGQHRCGNGAFDAQAPQRRQFIVRDESQRLPLESGAKSGHRFC